MLEKSRHAVFFEWVVCRVSRKVGLLKRRVWSHHVARGDKNCTRCARSTFAWSVFWSSDVEKLRAAVARRLKNRDGVGALWSYDVEKFCAAVARSTFATDNVKSWRCWSAFWGSDVEKLRAAVARSAVWSEHAKKLAVSEHFLKFRCRQNARGCGEKHMCFGALILKVTCRKISQLARLSVS